MDAFNQLRRQAIERRRKAVKLARDEYATTISKIAEQEQASLGYDPTSRKTIASCVNLSLPLDKPFTLQDIMDALVASDPQREWPWRIVKNHICKLKRRGIIRWVKRTGGQQPAIYVRAG